MNNFEAATHQEHAEKQSVNEPSAAAKISVEAWSQPLEANSNANNNAAVSNLPEVHFVAAQGDQGPADGYFRPQLTQRQDVNNLIEQGSLTSPAGLAALTRFFQSQQTITGQNFEVACRELSTNGYTLTIQRPRRNENDPYHSVTIVGPHGTSNIRFRLNPYTDNYAN